MDWVGWALQFLVVLVMGRLWLAIDNNTKSVSELREVIAKEYLPRAEFDRRNEAFRDSVHTLRDQMQPLASKVAVLEERSALAPLLERIAAKLDG